MLKDLEALGEEECGRAAVELKSRMCKSVCGVTGPFNACEEVNGISGHEGVGDRVSGDEATFGGVDAADIEAPADDASCCVTCNRACAGCSASTTPCLPSIPGPRPTVRFDGRPSYGLGRRFLLPARSKSRRLVGAMLDCSWALGNGISSVESVGEGIVEGGVGRLNDCRRGCMGGSLETALVDLWSSVIRIGGVIPCPTTRPIWSRKVKTML